MGFVVAGHGSFATGLASAVAVILGAQDAFAAVPMLDDDSPDLFQQRLSNAVETVDRGAGAVVLVDLPGATPFTAAARLARERPGLEVISGANLPMLLETLVRRDGQALPDVAALAIDAGPRGIVRWVAPT